MKPASEYPAGAESLGADRFKGVGWRFEGFASVFSFGVPRCFSRGKYAKEEGGG